MATIRKRNGRYQAQVRVTGCPPLSKTFITRKEATSWAKAWELKAETQNLDANIKHLDRTRLYDILDRYEKEISPRKRGAWREVYAILALKRHPISLKAISRVTEADAAQYRDDRLKLVKASTVCREIAIFRHSLETARRLWGLPLLTNVFAAVQKPKLNNARTRRLEDGEWAVLKSACESSRNPCLLDMVYMGLETAMRRGEVLNIRKIDVDFRSKTLHIPDTKNGFSRIIPLSGEALAILLRRAASLNDPDKLFPTTEIAFRMAWRRVMRKAKLKDFHFHDLRREAISRFLELGLEVPEVALISGHRCYKMLFRYVNLRAENVAAKLARLSAKSV